MFSLWFLILELVLFPPLCSPGPWRAQRHRSFSQHWCHCSALHPSHFGPPWHLAHPPCMGPSRHGAHIQQSHNHSVPPLPSLKFPGTFSHLPWSSSSWRRGEGKEQLRASQQGFDFTLNFKGLPTTGLNKQVSDIFSLCRVLYPKGWHHYFSFTEPLIQQPKPHCMPFGSGGGLAAPLMSW